MAAVDGDDGVLLVLGHVHEHAVAENPVVDEDVEPAVALDRAADHVLGGVEVRDVVVARDRLSAGGDDLVDDALRQRGWFSPLSRPPRSFTTTFAPARASASACSRPMPRPAPVTIATFPSSDGTGGVLSSARGEGNSRRGVGQAPSFVEIEVDEAEAHEVLVRVEATGVCHSDLHVMETGFSHPPPILLGHEARASSRGSGRV